MAWTVGTTTFTSGHERFRSVPGPRERAGSRRRWALLVAGGRSGRVRDRDRYESARPTARAAPAASHAPRSPSFSSSSPRRWARCAKMSRVRCLSASGAFTKKARCAPRSPGAMKNLPLPRPHRMLDCPPATRSCLAPNGDASSLDELVFASDAEAWCDLLLASRVHCPERRRLASRRTRLSPATSRGCTRTARCRRTSSSPAPCASTGLPTLPPAAHPAVQAGAGSPAVVTIDVLACLAAALCGPRPRGQRWMRWTLIPVALLTTLAAAGCGKSDLATTTTAPAPVVTLAKAPPGAPATPPSGGTGTAPPGSTETTPPGSTGATPPRSTGTTPPGSTTTPAPGATKTPPARAPKVPASPPVSVPLALTPARAAAFARAVELTTADVPGAHETSRSSTPPSREREAAQCGGRAAPAIGNGRSPDLERGQRPRTRNDLRAVEVLHNAHASNMTSPLRRPGLGSKGYESVLAQSLKSEADPNIKLLRVQVAPLQLSVAGAGRAEGIRILARVGVPGANVVVKLFVDALTLRYGPAEIDFFGTSFVQPVERRKPAGAPRAAPPVRARSPAHRSERAQAAQHGMHDRVAGDRLLRAAEHVLEHRLTVARRSRRSGRRARSRSPAGPSASGPPAPSAPSGPPRGLARAARTPRRRGARRRLALARTLVGDEQVQRAPRPAAARPASRIRSIPAAQPIPGVGGPPSCCTSPS